MSESIEILPPRIVERLRGNPELLRQLSNQNILPEGERANVRKTFWQRHYGKILLGITAAGLSLGSSAGLWQKLAPLMGKWIGTAGGAVGKFVGGVPGEFAGKILGNTIGTKSMEGLDVAGGWVSARGADFWSFLKNTWNSIPGVNRLDGPGYVEAGHKATVDALRTYGTNNLPTP